MEKTEAIKGESWIDIAGPRQAKNKRLSKINERKIIAGGKRVTSESRNEEITQEDWNNKPEHLENTKKHNGKTCEQSKDGIGEEITSEVKRL